QRRRDGQQQTRRNEERAGDLTDHRQRERQHDQHRHLLGAARIGGPRRDRNRRLQRRQGGERSDERHQDDRACAQQHAEHARRRERRDEDAVQAQADRLDPEGRQKRREDLRDEQLEGRERRREQRLERAALLFAHHAVGGDRDGAGDRHHLEQQEELLKEKRF